MIPFALRQIWRVIIFILGVYVLQVLIEVFWPDSGNRLAIFVALLVIYCLMAYAVIPALFRLYHFLIEHDHIPLYATYGDGWPSDPVNIAIIARNKKDLRNAMKMAGWYEADPHSLKNNLHEIWSIIFNTPYQSAPVSNLYLFNRKHDIAFQIPTNARMSARTRHHIRFWRLEQPRKNRHDRGHFEFWSEKLKKWLHRKSQIWIGACTEEPHALDIRWRTGQLTHGGSHESDKERDFIIQTLQNQGLVKSIYTSEPGEKLKFRGQQFRTVYITNGSIKIVRLK